MDEIISSLGVPSSVLEGDPLSSYSTAQAALQAFASTADEMRKSTALLVSTINILTATQRWLDTKTLKALTKRKRCWWQCKRWERLRNGRHPIIQGDL